MSKVFVDIPAIRGMPGEPFHGMVDHGVPSIGSAHLGASGDFPHSTLGKSVVNFNSQLQLRVFYSFVLVHVISLLFGAYHFGVDDCTTARTRDFEIANFYKEGGINAHMITAVTLNNLELYDVCFY
jgi:hypothetical protein